MPMFSLDSDDDDIPDNWERTYFGSTNAVNGGPNEDYDGDGIPNVEEYIVGSDPSVTNRGPIVGHMVNTNGVVQFDLLTSTGRVYDVETSTTIVLPNWQLYTSFVGNGSSMTVSNALMRRYYRYQVRMENP